VIDRHTQAFHDEAIELLAELESALLELDGNREDREVVGRAFRALHTIKGSGAMFGFEHVAGFAHHLENAFDRLRNATLAVSTELITVTLAAKDQIRTMLDAGPAERADSAQAIGILAELARLTGETEQAPAAPVVPVASGTVENGAIRQWRLLFRPGPDVLRNGTNPLMLIGELGEMGELKASADASAIPDLNEIDPERCYLAWDMTLATAAEQPAIRDVFIFVEGECELSIEPAGPAPKNPEQRKARVTEGSSSLRVSADKLDQLVNLVGELVTVQARLTEIAARRDDAEVLGVAEEVERLTTALRENSMSIRMLPLRTTFERFRRLVHDLGTELHKQVELSIEGADTELDKTVIDHLNDPLVHLIRNSMDHGIETPEARRAAGKDPVAKIHLSAQYSGAAVLIQVSDDGRGLNVDAIRARAVERGLIAANVPLSDSDVVSLILAPGFSTAREITDVSGRGVGMDVVRRSVEALRGVIEVASKPGAGVTVTLRLPLTLAIIDGLLVRVGDAHFVLPLANSLECVELTAADIREAHGNHIANVRGQMVPYIRLSEYFHTHGPRPEREQIMVVETEHGHYGFAVDEVLGDHQTVIKNLGRLYRNVQVVSGATILGNGTVALILDPHRLVQNAIRQKNNAGHSLIRKENTIDVT
jgi:two-component system, chemotaxis family, sensor kinase CheA